MSWSYNYIGDPRRAVDDANMKFAEMGSFQEPEETMRKGTQALILNALASWPSGVTVAVTAAGSQSQNPEIPTEKTNTLTLHIRAAQNAAPK